MLSFDHIAVLCEHLEEGVAHVEAALGVRCDAGGTHEVFGTHNRLLSLGGNEYLEVIAIDPEAPKPGRARWFDLDRFTGEPRLARWICSVDDLDEALRQIPEAGEAVDLERGAYRWRIGVPANGILPMENLHPSLIEWRSQHPGRGLEDRGLRLKRLIVGCADMKIADERVEFLPEAEGLAALITTPEGEKWLR